MSTRPGDDRPDAAATESERARVLREVSALSRQPFREALSLFMSCAPSGAAIRAAAERDPSRWAQCVAILSRASGFSERLEVEGEIGFNVRHLSDSELADRLDAAERRLKALRDAPPEKSAPRPHRQPRALESAPEETEA